MLLALDRVLGIRVVSPFGSSSWKLNKLGKYLFQYYFAVGKLAHFTIIYA